MPRSRATSARRASAWCATSPCNARPGPGSPRSRPAVAATRSALRALDDVDAIARVATSLSMARLAAAAEFFLGKPAIAIDAATGWQALRADGITDRPDGLGRLREEF